MSQNLLFILYILMMLLSSCSCSETLPSPSPGLNHETDRYLADYQYMLNVIHDNYPYRDIVQQMTGKDFDAMQAQYRSKIETIQTDADFFDEIVQPYLEEFDYIGHISVVTKEEYHTENSAFEYLLKEDSLPAYGNYILEQYNLPNVRRFYTTAMNRDFPTVQNQKMEQDELSSSNLHFFYYPDDAVARVCIERMLTSDRAEEDAILLENFFSKIDQEGYQHCIIDIRGNPGGNDYYWKINVVLPNLTAPLSYTTYALIRGELSASYTKISERKIDPISEFPIHMFPNLSIDTLEEFEYYSAADTIIDHTDTYPYSPLFKGKMWLLVDRRVYSAASEFAEFCKATGFATIVGTATRGTGGLFSPMILALPNTGICFRFSSAIPVHTDGTFDEQVGTIPDVLATPGDELRCCLDVIQGISKIP